MAESSRECYIPLQPNAEARERSLAIWREASDRLMVVDPRPVDCACSVISQLKITVRLPMLLAGAWNPNCKLHGDASGSDRG